MSTFAFDAVNWRYPQATENALSDFSFAAEDGEFVVLLGPSGSGKTTALRMLAGLDVPQSGHLRIAGRDVTFEPPKRRNIAMVFQNYALYPHMTVRDNMGFGLRLRRVDRSAIAARVQEVANVLGLGGLLDRFPGQLSGGQRQRVAMGRAMARDPDVYLMDEPLSNLDAELRAELRAELKLLHQRYEASFLYVTHDQAEAMTLADRMAVMNDGRLQQIGTPTEVYDDPVNKFVAGFLGQPKMRFLPIEANGSGFSIFGQRVELGRSGIDPDAIREATEVGMRSDALTFGDGRHQIKGNVEIIEYYGMQTYVVVRLEGTAATDSIKTDEGTVRVLLTSGAAPAVGEPVRLSFDPSDWFFFRADGTTVARR